MRGLRYGVGIMERGEFPTCDGTGKATQLARRWDKMLYRCYGPKHNPRTKSYEGCEVDPRFHRFQDFAAWAVRQCGFDQPGFALDKDILVRGNRVYGPDTCAFIPRDLNLLMVSSRQVETGLPTGVGRMARTKGFAAQISVRNKKTWIGNYPTPEDAFAAYKARKEQLIKEAAEQYRAMIDPRVYQALLAFEVLPSTQDSGVGDE